MNNIFKYFYYLHYRPKIFFTQKTYSSYGEDLIIEKFFKDKKKGFYIDIGCYIHLKEVIRIYFLRKDGMV